MSWVVLATSELRLLVRSPVAVVNAVLFPVAIGAGWVLLARDTGKDLGADAVAMQILVLLGFTPYAGAVGVLVARRHELVLQRLRTTALSGAGALAGLLSPYVLVVLVQAALLAGVTAAAGGPGPDRWWPPLVALLAGTVLAVALAVLTAAVTPVPELVQLTTVPVVLSLFGGGLWLLHTPLTWPMLPVPGVAIAGLVRLGWQPGSVVPCLLAVLILTLVTAGLATRVFRWDRRQV
jgi:ABC-2 type transport system permease protein